MRCHRCSGLLRVERVHWRSPFTLRVCTACGDRTDETILANRRCMAAKPYSDWKSRLWDRVRLLARMEVAV